MGKLTVEERRRLNARRQTASRFDTVAAERRDGAAWARFSSAVGLIALAMSIVAASQTGLPALGWHLSSLLFSVSSLLEWLMPAVH
jgi:hypothetical protein